MKRKRIKKSEAKTRKWRRVRVKVGSKEHERDINKRNSNGRKERVTINVGREEEPRLRDDT